MAIAGDRSLSGGRSEVRAEASGAVAGLSHDLTYERIAQGSRVGEPRDKVVSLGVGGYFTIW